jgi:hypothetical protein
MQKTANDLLNWLNEEATDFDFANAATGPDANVLAKPGSLKRAHKEKKPAPPVTNKPRRTTKKSHRGPRIRETEEARSLLEKQLHGLYWWVFNASKMKGFIRAKGLHGPAEPELSARRNAAPEQSQAAGDDGNEPGTEDRQEGGT